MRPKAASPWLGLAEAARLRGVCRATLWRWVGGELDGPDGQPVRLRVRRVGKRWKTRRKWLEEFQAALDGTAPERPAAARAARGALADQRALARRLA